jgi:hypothetical protein
MKRFVFCLLLVLQAAASFYQTTGRLENLKDAWGTSFTYLEEIKSKQPNGVGVAFYNNGGAVRYAGGSAGSEK